jgi:hypothetical protein
MTEGTLAARGRGSRRSQPPAPDVRPALDEALLRRAVERAASRTYGGTWVAKTPNRHSQTGK